MSNLQQNLNQTFQTGMLGAVTRSPQPRTFPAQIDPSSTATVICAGCAVKLVNKAGPNIVVDVTTGPTDGPVVGVIPYSTKKNTYAAGEPVEVVGDGGVVLLKSSAAIVRGTNVAGTNPSVSTNDPTVATTTTVNDYVVGQALTQAGGANQLIEVLVRPGKITTTGVLSLGN